MRPGRRRSTGAVAVATALLMALGLAATLASPGDAAVDTGAKLGLLSFLPPIAAFAIVGGLISVRRPENSIGGLMAAIALLFALVVASSSVSRWGLLSEGLPREVCEWISIGSSAWVVALGLIGTQLPLRLPDGRLPTPRWRWYSWVTIGLIAVALVGMGAQPVLVEDVPGTSNPLGAAWAEPLAGAFLLVALSFAGGVAALVVRYRRAGAHDRVQLRWVAFGGVVFLVVYGVTLPLEGILDRIFGIAEDSTADWLLTSFSQFAMGALPIAIGYAILRHNLYDIDVVVNRTLVYAALTATLAGTYLGGVLLLQLLLDPLTSGSGLAIAASTLATAALFAPARARIQSGVDRRFFRRRYDAQRTLESFGARLRDEVDLDELAADLRAVVGETVQPAHVSLWLREVPR